MPECGLNDSGRHESLKATELGGMTNELITDVVRDFLFYTREEFEQEDATNSVVRQNERYCSTSVVLEGRRNAV
jgi:hypothetical protein